VQHVGDAARHTRGKIPPGAPQYHHRAAGHVLAAVVAHPLHHGVCTRVTHGEALAGNATEIRFAADRAVEHDVTGDDVFSGLAAELGRGLHADAPAGKSFAAIVV